VYRNLKVQSAAHPIDGNLNGSALTMVSRSGFIFGIINIVGNFGTVFVDQVGGAEIGSPGHSCMPGRCSFWAHLLECDPLMTLGDCSRVVLLPSRINEPCNVPLDRHTPVTAGASQGPGQASCGCLVPAGFWMYVGVWLYDAPTRCHQVLLDEPSLGCMGHACCTLCIARLPFMALLLCLTASLPPTTRNSTPPYCCAADAPLA
jgi:hypothetical protein